MADLNLDERLATAREIERIPEQRLGATIIQPFTGLNSGSRKLMWAIHHQHKMNLVKGEAPYISTGNENEFLKYSSSFVLADCDKVVVRTVNKFLDNPYFHYWLIVANTSGPNKGDLDVIERVSYVYTTESYGFALNNDTLDNLREGSVIQKDQVIRIPDTVDQWGNVTDGVNLMTAYTSSLITQEDGYHLSESAALALGTTLYHSVQIQLNDNDIMLNLYGDDRVYKVMPDIGETIQHGILLAVRRQNNADALFSQTWDRLRTVIHPIDKQYTLNGTVIDIDLFNNSDQLEQGANAQYHQQIRGYLANKFRYCGEIIDTVETYRHYHPDAKLSFNLQNLYIHARDTVMHFDHHRNGKRYSGTIINLVVKQDLPLKQGDKFTNRFGGKGVVSKIVPDYMMPIIGNKRIAVLANKATVHGRLNYGQLFEIEINFRSMCFLEGLRNLPLTVDEKLAMIRDYMNFFSPNLAASFWKSVERLEWFEREMFLDTYLGEDIIRLCIRPLSDVVTIDTLIAVDTKYPWIKQKHLRVPIINSNGKLRYIEKSLRPIVAGYEFFVRLKQYAKEKFSVISISSVNLRNENTKSRAGNLYESPFADTPIKMGGMETEDMTHMDVYHAGITEITLMLYSSSSEMRNRLASLYFTDPVSINIELDDSSSSRSAEIFATYFKQLCDKFVFEKHLKEPVRCPWKVEIDPPWTVDIKEEHVPWTIDTTGAHLKKGKESIGLEVLVDEETKTITTDLEGKKNLKPCPITIRFDTKE